MSRVWTVRKKSKVVEALLWDGTNLAEVRKFLDYAYAGCSSTNDILVADRSGRVIARLGWWIVKDGGFWVMEPIKFFATYEAHP